MEFRKISTSDFLAISGGRHQRDGKRVEMEIALEALEIDQGFAVPCLWKHYERTTCGGAQTAHTAMKKIGGRIRTSCVNKVLYVLRVENAARRYDGS